MPCEWTEDDVRAYYDRIGKPYPDGIHARPGAKKESKYHNKRTEVDGIVFDSKREADRWGELRLLLKAGEILGLFRQVPFLLPGGVIYRADFVILNRGGQYTVEDAKGVKTKEYAIKKRQMKAVHGIDIVEV
jgi:hypothetical protein